MLRPDLSDEDRQGLLLPADYVAPLNVCPYKHCSHAFCGKNYHLQSVCDTTLDLKFMMCTHRDVELAKFEAFLAKQGGSAVNAMVRGRQRLAYPIKK